MGGSNAVTTKTYSATGQVQSVADPNGNVTTYDYDADDRVASMVDPLFRSTSYTYDAMSRLLTTTNLAIQATPLEQLAYTPDGLRASLTDANGHATSYAYDGFDRLSTATYPDSTTEQATYDADGNVLTRVTRKGDTISFSYDTLNRLSTKTPPSPEAVVSYSYDPAGRIVSVSDTSAAITAAAAPGGTTVQYAANLTYDQLNRPVNVTWSPAPSQTTPTTSAANFAFGYDATNRRISQAANDNSFWSYPGAAANVNYTANNLNQYAAVGSATPAYDGNGNLTYDGSFTYCYDAESRLTSIVTGSCASPSTTVAAYAYDAQGRRKSKTVGTSITVYVSDAKRPHRPRIQRR
jgi:YD repeat-containing protein